jgi:hypothetical protein
MYGKKLRSLFLITLIFSLLISIWMQSSMAVTGDGHIPFTDIRGSLAEKEIIDWAAKGLVHGYSDNTFKPDHPVTRAEFFTLVNRAFGYTKTVTNQFNDVAAADWFSGDIGKAAAAGYIEGCPDGGIKPNDWISRQETAVILSRIFSADSGKRDAAVSFTDNSRIPGWSRAAISTAVENGYMECYPDGSFQPAVLITRSGAVSVLHRAAGALYNKAGIYGPVEGTITVDGNVTISSRDIILKNTVIKGNLYLTEGIGDGNATLDNVIVKGTMLVKGGGIHSIVIINTILGKVSISVPDGSSVRLVASGNSAVGTVTAGSGTILEERGVTGSGFVDVVIPKGATVQLSGQFASVRVEKPNTRVNITNGSISYVSISQNAAGSTVTLGQGVIITTLTANAATVVNGQGTIGTLNVNTGGTTVTRTNVEVGSTPTTTIGGLTLVGNPAQGTGSSGGNVGGSNGGDNNSGDDNDNDNDNGDDDVDTTTPVALAYTPADNSSGAAAGTNLTVTFSENITAAAGKYIFVKKSSNNSTAATIAAISSQISVSGVVVTINPVNDLDYDTEYYILIDAGAFIDNAGNHYSGLDDASAWNFKTAARQTTPTPAFSPAAGAVAFGTELRITSAGAEHIYYTMDGSEPATTAVGVTLEYNDSSRPVINSAVTVKAIATRTGYENSATGSVTYTQAATADLTGLALSGSPSNYSFTGSTYIYTGITVANVFTGITVTPAGTGAITVDGTEVASGTVSSSIGLMAGTPRTITVTARETGKSPKTYTITVTRQSATPVQATPAFNPAAGAVAFGTELRITSTGAEHIYYTMDGSEPATMAGGSTLEYNDSSRPVINAAMTVKAIATRTGYANSVISSVTYTQAATADLTGLALSGSPANYSFTGSTYTYMGVTVVNGVTGITVTPVGAGTITVNGTEVASGTASASIGLMAGTPRVITIVAREVGESPKTYTITVTRQAAAPVQTTPAFSPATGAVAFGTELWITSAGAEYIYYTMDGSEPATTAVGVTLEYNDSSRPVINSAVTVKAIATRTGYANSATGSVTYTQAATADLTGLVLSGSPSNYSFTGSTYIYEGVTVANGVTGITVMPAGAGTITVDGTPITSGTSSASISLTAGTPRTITVTARETGKSPKTYTITVTRWSGNVQLTSLTEDLTDNLSTGFRGDYYGTYYITATNAETMLNITPTLLGAAITWDVSTDNDPPAAVASGTAAAIPLEDGRNTITIHVEKAWANAKDYTIVVIKSPSIGEIAGGKGPYADGASVSFGKTFSTAPVVVVNACDSSGNPIIAGVVTSSTTGFALKLCDLDNHPVTSSVTVQWVAVNPAAFGPNVRVQAKYLPNVQDGDEIYFDHPFSAGEIPKIICSAYDSVSGRPVMAAPCYYSSGDRRSFTAYLRDADGEAMQASLWYIALVPDQDYAFYDEVSFVGNYSAYSDGTNLGFYLSPDVDVIICSAWRQDSNLIMPYAAAAWNISPTGCDLSLKDYDGNASPHSVWTSWVAFGFK